MNAGRVLVRAALILLLPVAVHAQMSMLPAQCTGKTGDELDRCVRDITLPMRSERMDPIEQKPDPTQTVNCLKVARADESFCIARNEIVIECRNRAKHPDFDACASRLLSRQDLPRPADCANATPATRNACALRNGALMECGAEPLRYFICVGEKLSVK